MNKLNNIFSFLKKKPIEPNKWINAAETLDFIQLFDKDNFNCVIEIDGKMTYGKMESSGVSYIGGYNNYASGEESKHGF